MAIVKHAFNCLITDDPAAAAAGQVTPSHWNEEHSIVLEADENFVTDAEKVVLANTSGNNTGDQDLSGLVPATRTINSKPLTANITLTSADVGADPAGTAATLVEALLSAPPETLDTLNELAAALGDDPNFATTVLNALSGKQPLDATLTALAALATAANKLIYATGTDQFATTDFTAFARTLLAVADAAAARTALGAAASADAVVKNAAGNVLIGKTAAQTVPKLQVGFGNSVASPDYTADVDIAVMSALSAGVMHVQAPTSSGYGFSSDTVRNAGYIGYIHASGLMEFRTGQVAKMWLSLDGLLSLGAQGAPTDVLSIIKTVGAPNSAGIRSIVTQSVGDTVVSNTFGGDFRSYSTHSSNIISYQYGVRSVVRATGAGGTVTNLVGYYAQLDAPTGTPLVTNAIGLWINDITIPVSATVVGLQSQISSGTGKWNTYCSGSAPNYFAGGIRIGHVTDTTLALSVKADAADTVRFWRPVNSVSAAAGRLLLGGYNASSAQADYAAIASSIETNTAGSHAGAFVINTASAGSLVEKLRVSSAGHTTPGGDNTQTLGSGTYRWSTVYAGTGTINTSDAREKTAVSVLTPAELAAAKQLSAEVGTYQFLAAVAEKGPVARRHVGMTVQRAIEIMSQNGLDPFAYGFICHDIWPERREEVVSEFGALSRTVTRQVIRKVEVNEETIEIINGVPTQILTPVIVDEPVFDMLQIIGADGNPLVDEIPALVDTEGNELEPARTEPRLHQVPVMETVEERYDVVVTPPGDRYSFRPDELLLFIARGLDERMRALESFN